MSGMIRRWLVLSLILFGSLGTVACGARTRSPAEETSIDVLRKKARKAPNDPAIWSELAIAEHLSDGGDPEAARESLAHARKLGADSLRLLYVEAEEHVLEGRPEQAFAAFTELAKRARTDNDPLAPLFAELALSSLSDMNDAVNDYRARLQQLLSELRPDADKLGLTAAHTLRMQTLGLALQAGDLATAADVAKDAGCVQQAQAAGPFGPRELLGFDQVLPPEAPGPFAASYDLGPGRGDTKVRNLSTRRCMLGVGRGAREAFAGTSYVRTEITVEKAQDYVLRLESPNSLVLWVDGKEIDRVDLRTQPAFGVRFLPLTLSAGKHEFKVKVSSRHPNPVVALSLVPGTLRDIERVAIPENATSLERYVAAKVALTRGNGVYAREILRKVEQTKPSAHWLVLSAAASIADPLRPAELRRDGARELLRRAHRQNPKAWYPAVGLANLEAAEGRRKEAIDALRETEQRWPDVIAIRTSLIDQLRDRGFVEEADERIQELARAMPDACAVANLELSAARARGRIEQMASVVERVMKCDSTSTARFAVLKSQRKYREAAAELARLRDLADPIDDTQRVESDLEQAELLGEASKVRALREKRSELWRDRPGPVIDQVDRLLESGNKQAAVDYLAAALEKYPNQLHETRRVHEALGGESLFQAFRKDGAAVIAEFEKSAKDYQEPQVLVLDYTVVRVFEDGSSSDLTHNIIRLQSQEAVDENGEFSVPDGARLLTLRTVKADGTRLEPEPIAGKSSLSLPNLAPSDYVEFETVRGESPSVGFPGGYLGNRFYFRSFEVPFHHSELVVILPASMEPVFDPRGPAPKLVQETRDGVKILRWTERESAPLTQEPLSVAAREFLPSVNLGIKVSWEAYVESLRDLLADKDIVDPAAKQTLLAILGDETSAPASVKAQRLYRWVTDQIEPTDEVFGLAPAMLATRTGHRERILKYLLTLADIPSDLVLVRGIDADHSDAKLPDPETFGHLVLRVQTEKGEVFLHCGQRHAPFGYLPAHIRNEEALVLNAKAERTRTPKGDVAEDLRSVVAKVDIKPNGAATLRVRETLRGQNGISWRNDLDEIPAAELSARFEEGYAPSLVPGARLTSLSVAERENAEVPLVVEYELEVDSLGHRVDKELRLPPLVTSQLAARFARLAARTVTEVVAPVIVTDVEVEYSLPKDAKVVSVPAPQKSEHPVGASFSASARGDDTSVALQRSLRVPVGRVKPEAYPGFAAFCRGVDQAEAAELVVQLP